MLKPYTAKLNPYVPLLLRLVIGAIFLGHGLLKLQNPAGVIGFFEFLNIPLPAVTAWFILILELVGGVGLILGLGTRWLGLLFAIQMVVVILLVKLQVGFIAMEGTGYELELALLAGSLALAALGSGLPSLEHNVLQREL